jgi:hypothetical protein
LNYVYAIVAAPTHFCVDVNRVGVCHAPFYVHVVGIYGTVSVAGCRLMEKFFECFETH